MAKLEEWVDPASYYYVIGDGMVLCGMVMYSYEDDGWKLAPDVYKDFVEESAEADRISEDEARRIVEEHGGKNFDNKKEYIVAFADGKVSGLAK